MPEVRLEAIIEAGTTQRKRTPEGDIVTVAGPFPEATTVTYEEDSVDVGPGEVAVLSDHLEAQPADSVDALDRVDIPGEVEPAPATETPAVDEAPAEVVNIADAVAGDEYKIYEKEADGGGIERLPVIPATDSAQVVTTPGGEVVIPADHIGIIRGGTVDIQPASELDNLTEVGAGNPAPSGNDLSDENGVLVVHRSHLAVAHKLDSPVVIMETEAGPGTSARQAIEKVVSQEDIDGGAYLLRKGGGVWVVNERELNDNWLQVQAPEGDEDEGEQVYDPTVTEPAAASAVTERTGETVAAGAEAIREVEAKAAEAGDDNGVQAEAEAGTSTEVAAESDVDQPYESEGVLPA